MLLNVYGAHSCVGFGSVKNNKNTYTVISPKFNFQFLMHGLSWVFFRSIIYQVTFRKRQAIKIPK